MASEKRGLFYEALIYVLLRRIIKDKIVYWNQTPSQMTIDTDITIGTTVDNPDFLFLISHSTAEHNSDMKFWRNMGEVFEAKTLVKSKPKAICILMDDKFKENLLLIQPYAFDDFIIVSQESFGAKIIDFASTVSTGFPSGKEEKISFVEDLLSSDVDFQVCAQQFSDRLAQSLNKNNSVADKLWENVIKSLSKDRFRRIPVSKNTSLRRGLAKSLLFEKMPRKNEVISDVFSDLGIGQKTIRGTVLVDQEIKDVLDLIDNEQLSDLHSYYSSMEEFSILVQPLQNIKSFEKFWKYICDHWAKILDPSDLYTLLQKTSAKPHVELGEREDFGYIIPGWLVIILITLLKAKTEKRMDFGYSKIVNEIDLLKDPNNYAKKILEKSGVLEFDAIRSSRTIEYGLRDWLYGAARTNFNLQPSELALIAYVLSKKVSEKVGKKLDFALGNTVKNFFVSDTLETKLLSHPSFQPLKLLIINTLQKSQIQFENINYFPSPLRGLAVSDGKRVNVRAGSTNVIRSGSTLIRWVSVSDSGKEHKSKEFCGRVWGFRISVDETTGEISENPWVKKTILVIDGTFVDKDLLNLYKAGWDEILYPDEIKLLPQLIL